MMQNKERERRKGEAVAVELSSTRCSPLSLLLVLVMVLVLKQAFSCKAFVFMVLVAYTFKRRDVFLHTSVIQSTTPGTVRFELFFLFKGGHLSLGYHALLLPIR